jgi:CBS domain-containing protein
MEGYQVGRLPVLNGEVELVGIISLADVVTKTAATDKKAEMVEQISKPAPPSAA